MWDLILQILFELGLIREDRRHRKKMDELEKKTGKPQRMRRYFLRPTVIVFSSIFLLGLVYFMSRLWIQRHVINPRETRRELKIISERLEKWKEVYGQYPASLEQITVGRPLDNDLLLDAWNREYRYFITSSGEKFVLVSSGVDGEFDTRDDLSEK